MHEVFDISVADLHAFIAGTVVVHNCIGNSGPLADPIAEAIDEHKLTCSAVLSGNRNFEGRIHPQVKMSWLASPPLVVAYALAGTVDIDITSEPLGTGTNGDPVYLRDIWPTAEEIATTVSAAIDKEQFRRRFAEIFTGDERWNALDVPTGSLYQWSADSTYIAEPPFVADTTPDPKPVGDIDTARVLVHVGDSVTTDHISPAGSIRRDGPAGGYLQDHGVKPVDFNSYGSRRGDHEVMMRGTFGNIRLRNMLVPGDPWFGGQAIRSNGLAECLDVVERESGWNTPFPAASTEFATGATLTSGGAGGEAGTTGTVMVGSGRAAQKPRPPPRALPTAILAISMTPRPATPMPMGRNTA